jgi:hypothetical protein
MVWLLINGRDLERSGRGLMKILSHHLVGGREGKLRKISVGFEVLTAVVMKSTIFWDITPCSPLSIHRRFGGTYRFHLQGRKNKFSNKPAWKQVASSFHAGLLLNLFFDPEDGGNMFLRNVGWPSTDYTALRPEDGNLRKISVAAVKLATISIRTAHRKEPTSSSVVRLLVQNAPWADRVWKHG